MPLCHDPLVSLLNSFGFNALRVPRSDYVPGSVLIRSGDGVVSLFGTIKDAFDVSDGVSLEVTKALAGEQFEGANSANYRIGVAAKLLSDWLPIATPSLASGFGGAKRISYQIRKTRLLATSVVSILRLLTDAEPTAVLLLLDRTRLFVVSEVLQTKELVLIAQSNTAGTVAFDASLISGVAAAGTASCELDASKAASGILRFAFGDFHTIGFKAHELEIAEGQYRLSTTGNKPGLSHLAPTDKKYLPIVFDGEPLL
jgi:hypothetical protein